MAADMHSYGGRLKVNFNINTAVRDVLRKKPLFSTNEDLIYGTDFY